MALFLLENRDFLGYGWYLKYDSTKSFQTLTQCCGPLNTGKLYMSFENEQYKYIHEAYGSVELYAIYNVLICFVYTMPFPDTLIVYMRFYIFKIVFLS
jgi:hypothetical protein